jgi:hypothetical protein
VTLPRGDVWLGPGLGYRLLTVAHPGADFKVIALGPNSERATPPNNPVHLTGVTLDWVWLVGQLKYGIRAVGASLYVEGPTPQLVRPVSSAVYESEYRSLKVPTFGPIRGHEGVLEGAVPNIYGFSADDWKGRLDAILQRQRSLRSLRLISRRIDINVALLEGYTIDAINLDGKQAWHVSIPFVEV